MTDLQPSDLEPSEVHPSEVQPSDLEPSEVHPSEVQPSDLEPSDVHSSEVQPSDLEPSDPESSDVYQTDVHPTSRTRVRRHRERADYHRATVDAILDEGMICHVAASVDGVAWMIPTAYGRDGDHLYLHGAAGNHLLSVAAAGGDIVVVVSLLDGIVLARSTFSHSINYRSVVVFGRAEEVTEPAAKAHGLEVIVDRLVPGRSAEARSPTESELRKTAVIRLAITEASAKVRSGPPLDQEGDVGLPVWAGVLPLRTAAGPPEPDPANADGVDPPAGLVQPARWASAG